MTSDQASPDDITITAESVKVTVKEGRTPWRAIAIIGAILLLAILAVLLFVRVPVLSEETYYVNETVVKDVPFTETVVVARAIETNETYEAQESYLPMRNFTSTECNEEPLAYNYTLTGDLKSNTWDPKTRTGYDSTRGTYVKQITICNEEAYVTAAELALAKGQISRTETILYTLCNQAAGTAQDCYDYKTTIEPGICTTTQYAWKTPFSTDKDVTLSEIKTTSTQKVCKPVTREIPLDEFEKKLGTWAGVKNYTQNRTVMKTRTITNYTNETILRDSTRPETFIKEVPKTRTLVKTKSLWHAIFA